MLHLNIDRQAVVMYMAGSATLTDTHTNLRFTNCGWRFVISPATGHVTLLHNVAGLARVALVVADFKGIRDG